MKSQNQSHKMSVKVTEYHSNFLETIFYDLLELIIFYQMQLSCDSPVTPVTPRDTFCDTILLRNP